MMKFWRTQDVEIKDDLGDLMIVPCEYPDCFYFTNIPFKNVQGGNVGLPIHVMCSLCVHFTKFDLYQKKSHR